MKLTLKTYVINNKISIIEKYNTDLNSYDNCTGIRLPELARYEYWIKIIMPDNSIVEDDVIGTNFRLYNIIDLYNSGYFQDTIDRAFNIKFLEDNL